MELTLDLCSSKHDFFNGIILGPFNDQPAGDGVLHRQTRSPAGSSLNFIQYLPRVSAIGLAPQTAHMKNRKAT